MFPLHPKKQIMILLSNPQRQPYPRIERKPQASMKILSDFQVQIINSLFSRRFYSIRLISTWNIWSVNLWSSHLERIFWDHHCSMIIINWIWVTSTVDIKMIGLMIQKLQTIWVWKIGQTIQNFLEKTFRAFCLQFVEFNFHLISCTISSITVHLILI